MSCRAMLQCLKLCINSYRKNSSLIMFVAIDHFSTFTSSRSFNTQNILTIRQVIKTEGKIFSRHFNVVRDAQLIKFRQHNVLSFLHEIPYTQLLCLLCMLFVAQCTKRIKQISFYFPHARQLPFSLRRLKSMHPDMWCLRWSKELFQTLLSCENCSWDVKASNMFSWFVA